ncbi:uncharacterized protein LOC127858823 isoform X2 [Dreissena polymorpha]|uniref:uncharacterized protein LOC127858823 isoform X2 n=1 Tax=Dreissena polymorpha TaxID=45954 RepID=UPI00226462F2|nr:uncharacterized protein LOC127858823 isoform X2 [Dreissena polymorpha]
MAMLTNLMTCMSYFTSNDIFNQTRMRCDNMVAVTNWFKSHVPCPPFFMPLTEIKAHVSRLDLPIDVQNYMLTVWLTGVAWTSQDLSTSTQSNHTSFANTTPLASSPFATSPALNRTDIKCNSSSTIGYEMSTEETVTMVNTSFQNPEDTMYVDSLDNQAGTIAGVLFGILCLVIIVLAYKINGHTRNRHQQDSHFTDLRMRGGIDLPQYGTLEDTYTGVHLKDVVGDERDKTSSGKDIPL